ncbi:MAG: glycosyltransferase family 39 protein [Candidatus Pacebacteria bacterium]|nr:glycosyltransferase family 39 protein [Candidatus Paceibacterota bacterium]
MNLISDFHSNYKKLEEFVCVLFIIFSGFLISAIYKINNFWSFPNLDEMLWHYRSNIFWDKILAFDFSGLIQSAQPGITVYWFTGFMMKFFNFDFNDVMIRIAEKNAEGLDFNHAINNHDMATYKAYETISFAFNVPLFILLVVFFIAFYYLLKKLEFGKIIASFSLLFIVINTYLQFWTTPSDKMLNIFMTLSFLTILVYLPKRKNKKYLILSAIFGAWAVLSKISALFILPFYFLIFIYYRWPLNKEKLKTILKDYLSWIFIFVLISIIFLPSIITNPNEVYDLIFKSNAVITNNPTTDYHITDGLLKYASLSLAILIRYLSHIFFISLLSYLFIKYSKKYKTIFNNLPQKHINTMSAYIILFIIMVISISDNADTRFMTPAFMMLNVLAAIGLYGAVEIITKKNNTTKKFKELFYISIFFVTIMLQIIFLTLNGTLLKTLLQ